MTCKHRRRKELRQQLDTTYIICDLHVGSGHRRAIFCCEFRLNGNGVPFVGLPLTWDLYDEKESTLLCEKLIGAARHSHRSCQNSISIPATGESAPTAAPHRNTPARLQLSSAPPPPPPPPHHELPAAASNGHGRCCTACSFRRVCQRIFETGDTFVFDAPSSFHRCGWESLLIVGCVITYCQGRGPHVVSLGQFDSPAPENHDHTKDHRSYGHGHHATGENCNILSHLVTDPTCNFASRIPLGIPSVFARPVPARVVADSSEAVTRPLNPCASLGKSDVGSYSFWARRCQKVNEDQCCRVSWLFFFFFFWVAFIAAHIRCCYRS